MLFPLSEELFVLLRQLIRYLFVFIFLLLRLQHVVIDRHLKSLLIVPVFPFTHVVIFVVVLQCVQLLVVILRFLDFALDQAVRWPGSKVFSLVYRFHTEINHSPAYLHGFVEARYERSA